MALVFFDGFAQYNFDEYTMGQFGWSLNNAALESNGPGAMHCLEILYDSRWAKLEIEPLSSLVFGFYKKDVERLAGRQLRVWNTDGNYALLLRSGAGVYDVEIGTTKVGELTLDPLNRYVHYEIKLIISSTGTLQIRRNGIEVFRYDGDTSAAKDVQSIQWDGDGGPMELSGVHLMDSTGIQHNDFIGPTEIVFMDPSADGSVTDFVAQGGGANYTEINDADTATYVESATLNARDLYQLTNPSASASGVVAVGVITEHRQLTAGAREIAAVVSSNGSAATGPARSTVIDWTLHLNLFETSPDTGAAFTPAELNSLQAGVEIVS